MTEAGVGSLGSSGGSCGDRGVSRSEEGTRHAGDAGADHQYWRPSRPTYDSATRFQADICQVSGPVATAANYCGGNSGGTFEVPTVNSDGAAVKRLIVDNVSGTCSSFNNAALFVKEIRIFGHFVPDSVPNGDTKPAHLVPIVGPAYSYINDPSIGPLGGIQETDYTFGQTTHFAFNPGDTVTMDYFAFYPGVGANDVGCLVRIEGFFVNQ